MENKKTISQPQTPEEKRLAVINSMLKYWRKKENIARSMIQKLIMIKKTLIDVGLIEK